MDVKIDTIVINLFGAPGAGKSTTAALVYGKLKEHGTNCELIREYAKELVWEGRKIEFNEQLAILGKQAKRLSAVDGKVWLAITDAPIALSLYYNFAYNKEAFNKVVLECFNKYNNMNYFIERTKEYNPIGRMQTEAESDQVAVDLKKVLDENGVTYKIVTSDTAVHVILEDIIALIFKESDEEMFALAESKR